MINIILGFIAICILIGFVYLNVYLDNKIKSKQSLTELITKDINNLHYKYSGSVDTVVKTDKNGKILEATFYFHYLDPKLKQSNGDLK